MEFILTFPQTSGLLMNTIVIFAFLFFSKGLKLQVVHKRWWCCFTVKAKAPYPENNFPLKILTTVKVCMYAVPIQFINLWTLGIHSFTLLSPIFTDADMVPYNITLPSWAFLCVSEGESSLFFRWTFLGSQMLSRWSSGISNVEVCTVDIKHFWPLGTTWAHRNSIFYMWAQAINMITPALSFLCTLPISPWLYFLTPHLLFDHFLSSALPQTSPDPLCQPLMMCPAPSLDLFLSLMDAPWITSSKSTNHTRKADGSVTANMSWQLCFLY